MTAEEYAKVEPYIEALQEMTHRYELVVRDLSILRQLNNAADPNSHLKDVCRRTLETIAFGIAAENCSLMLLDDQTDELELRAACSPLEEHGRSYGPGEWTGHRFKKGEGIVGKVAESGLPLRISDVTLSKDFIPSQRGGVHVASLVCFPLVADGRTIGVLNLSHSKPNFFSLERENTLALVAERAAKILMDHILREHLRESEAYHRLIADNAGDGILTFDERGRIVSANPAVERITGIPTENFICAKVKWEQGVHPEDLEEFITNRQKVLDLKQPLETAYRYTDSKGTIHFLEQSSSPLVDTGEIIRGVVSIIRDVTERKKTEEERQEMDAQIQQSQRLESLGILASGIAHDFNNLLSTILGYASLALANPEIPSPVVGNLEQIQFAGREAADLCKQLLAYSGRGRFLVKPINLSELVERMTGLLEITISKKVSIDYRLESDIPYVEADPSQLGQVVMNLISNASEAIGDDTGVITITTGLCENQTPEVLGDEGLGQGSFVFVEVNDTGAGMDKETKDRIFDPFFTTKVHGRGLGLAAVQGIVRSHNAGIAVSSEIGNGTTFTLFFPVTDKVPKQEEPRQRQHELLGKGAVLVVDDEPTVLELVRQMLEHQGFQVLKACDGLEAIETLKSRLDEIVLVLLDLTMPRLGGVDALHEMRKISPDLPIVLTSGFDERDACKTVLASELSGFLQKPFGLSDLVEKVWAALEK